MHGVLTTTRQGEPRIQRGCSPAQGHIVNVSIWFQTQVLPLFRVLKQDKHLGENEVGKDARKYPRGWAGYYTKKLHLCKDSKEVIE